MKRIITLIFSFLFALMMLISCAASPNTEEFQQDNSSSSSVEEEPSSSPSDDTAEPESGKTGLGDLSGNVTSDSDRKLVYKADYNIETLDYDGDYQKIVSATKKYNGYFSFEDSHGTKPAKYGDSGRISELTIRIPVDHYTAFTEELSTVGQIIQKNQNTEDITGAYLDVESRISLLETQYKKLDAHLQKATKMSDIIELEEEMSKILNELEELRGTRRNYDNMVNYTTINVYLKEVVKLTEVPTSEEGFWDRASEGFNSTAKSVGVFFESLGVFFISASPVLFILALIAVAVIAIVRLVIRKRKRKEQFASKNETTNSLNTSFYSPQSHPSDVNFDEPQSHHLNTDSSEPQPSNENSCESQSRPETYDDKEMQIDLTTDAKDDNSEQK